MPFSLYDHIVLDADDGHAIIGHISTEYPSEGPVGWEDFDLKPEPMRRQVDLRAWAECTLRILSDGEFPAGGLARPEDRRPSDYPCGGYNKRLSLWTLLERCWRRPSSQELTVDAVLQSLTEVAR